MPTPLGLVSQHNNSTEDEDIKEMGDLSKSEITYVSDNTTGDEDTILNLENIYRDNTGDKDSKVVL